MLGSAQAARIDFLQSQDVRIGPPDERKHSGEIMPAVRPEPAMNVPLGRDEPSCRQCLQEAAVKLTLEDKLMARAAYLP
ncbi:MAG TPA: hypothetical protein VFZ16_01710 [Hyphomicrobiaceae bacterium]|nr:hypothetical protein [Hyphomicrobiaceae bacterium]